MPAQDPADTELDVSRGALASPDARASAVQQFVLDVVEGPSAGASLVSSTDRCGVGSHPSNDLVIDDRQVSRFHFEVRLGPDGARIRDLDSRNGTSLDGIRIADAWLRDGSVIRVGQTGLRFRLADATNVLPISARTSFGTLVGRSVAMRAAFGALERAAASDSTVLLEGETGTGKEEAAISIHEASARSAKPFVIVDCGAIPGSLLESELFGHERGAFTGAVSRRIGAFEEAEGGTIFLDEISELPVELQPKLLRVLERRTVRRVGDNAQRRVDVRVIAATNRNVRAEVNDGRFRPDLYYRLAVLRVVLPPLRERPEDIAPLVDRILAALGADRATAERIVTPELRAHLERGAWPGNVRELRNHLEHCLVMDRAPPLERARGEDAGPPPVELALSYAEARRAVVDRFEQEYVRALLERHGGNISQAARTAGMNRAYLYRLLSRLGLR